MSSSVTKSGPQRSCSFTSTTQPHRLSRLPIRNSIQTSRGKSLCRPEKLSLDRNTRRASSQSNDLSQLGRQRSGSLVRQTLHTPMGCGSARRSPLMSSLRKDMRPISDKRWQNEQTVKVRTFVAQLFPHLDQNGIKSGISLELFIALMDCYFKLIDKRISITRENYVEEVPVNLKRYRYPASVKPSLMKTVNTPYSWPHVVSIFSWLTDVITQINDAVHPTSELITVVDDCVMDWYTQWCNIQDEGEVVFALDYLESQLDIVLKCDNEEMDRLEEEVNIARVEALTYNQQKHSTDKKIEALKSNITSVTEKCDMYLQENENFEKQIQELQVKYTTKIKNIDQELAALHTTEAEAKAVIACQPYSFPQKQQLAQELKDLQNTLKLMEDRYNQQRELVSACDIQHSGVKQQMEACAYQYNNIVNQLVLINKEFERLRIRENGFARRDTQDEVKEVLMLMRGRIAKFKQQQEEGEKILEELAEKLKQIDKDIAGTKKEEAEKSKLEAELTITYEHYLKQDEQKREIMLAEVHKYQNGLLTVRKSKFDLTPLQERVEQLEKEKHEHLEFKKDLQKRALEFFLKLEERMLNNLQTYMTFMEEIAAVMESAQEKAISNSKSRLEKLKQMRMEVEGDRKLSY